MAENRYCDIEAFLDTIPQYAGESGVVRAGALLEELGHPEKTLKIIESINLSILDFKYTFNAKV